MVGVCGWMSLLDAYGWVGGWVGGRTFGYHHGRVDFGREGLVVGLHLLFG